MCLCASVCLIIHVLCPQCCFFGALTCSRTASVSESVSVSLPFEWSLMSNLEVMSVANNNFMVGATVTELFHEGNYDTGFAILYIHVCVSVLLSV